MPTIDGDAPAVEAEAPTENEAFASAASGEPTEAGRRLAEIVALPHFKPGEPASLLAGIIEAPDLLDLDFPEPKPIIEHLLYEGLSILAGRPKLGKSFLALNLARAVASGDRALEALEVTPGDVLYLALEDGPRRLHDRLKRQEAAKWTISNRLGIVTTWPRAREGGLEALEKWIEWKAEPRLIVVDTLEKFRSRTKGSDLYREDYGALGELQELANRTEGLGILVVHHTRKAEADDFLDAVSGTTGITAGADSVLVMSRSRGDAEAQLRVTGRDVEERTHALRFEGEWASWELMGGEEWTMTRERREIVRYLEEIHPETAWPKEIAESLGKPGKVGSIKPLLARLRENGKVTRTAKGYTVHSVHPG